MKDPTSPFITCSDDNACPRDIGGPQNNYEVIFWGKGTLHSGLPSYTPQKILFAGTPSRPDKLYVRAQTQIKRYAAAGREGAALAHRDTLCRQACNYATCSGRKKTEPRPHCVLSVKPLAPRGRSDIGYLNQKQIYFYIRIMSSTKYSIMQL